MMNSFLCVIQSNYTYFIQCVSHDYVLYQQRNSDQVNMYILAQLLQRQQRQQTIVFLAFPFYADRKTQLHRALWPRRRRVVVERKRDRLSPKEYCFVRSSGYLFTLEATGKWYKNKIHNERRRHHHRPLTLASNWKRCGVRLFLDSFFNWKDRIEVLNIR